MNRYKIRIAQVRDLPRILEIYAIARKFMAEHGNPHQWGVRYPEVAQLQADIHQQRLYVVTDGETVRGVFYFVIGPDPTYGHMEGGSWRSEMPYGTIHRIAGDGSGGIFSAALDFCLGKISHIRIDTHHDNHTMQFVLARHGFSRRGIIYVADGSPRIAYDYLNA